MSTITKDAELIQVLVDALSLWPDTLAQLKDQITALPGEVDTMDEACNLALAAAESSGFKPTT